ncbi:MAG: hypothetical protein IPM64_07405 [Phycisphaerales bacterium]|nr:hypothetical protein [Phycisphaerales bacterium]
MNVIRSIPAESSASHPAAANGRAQDALGRASGEPRSALIRRTAEGLSAAMFFGPMLEQMRSDPTGREFAHGGRGEDAFGQLLDQRIAAAAAAADRGGVTAQIESWIGRAEGGRDRGPSVASSSGTEVWA